MTRKLQLLAGMLLISAFLVPLSGQSELKKAKKQYELRAFELAAYNYNQVLKENPDHVEAMISLGLCFQAMNNDLEASKYFAKASERVILAPDELLAYGKVLMKLVNYNGARTVFDELAQFDPITAEHFTLSCDFAEKALKLPLAYDVSPFAGNTPTSDFGLTPYKDKWVFMSFRPDLKEKDTPSVAGSKLCATGVMSSDNASVSLLRQPLKSSYRLGPISYSEDYSMAAIMKNNFREGYQPVFEGDEEESILLADVDADGDFYNERPFKHNEIGSSAAFPCLSFNGDALYFSSNRSGGYGGYDLYVSYKIDGEWTMPENLGADINTPGNEITPFFDDHTLYFSSDYHHGLGGYDVFKSIVYNGSWAFPENMGNGVNSPGDDLYPNVDQESKKIYLSSNRLGTRGNLDLFTVTKVIDGAYAMEVVEPQTPMVSLVADEGFKIKTIEPPVVEEEESIDEFTKEEEADLAIEKSPKVEVQEPVVTQDPVQKKDEKPEAIVLDRLKTAPSSTPHWEGAKMVGFDESLLNGTKVYFIQLAALSKTAGDKKDFARLSKYGNIYRVPQSNLVKIRLGYFLDRNEASKVLSTVKSYGYQDAFITHQTMNTSEMELMLANDNLSGAGDNSSYMVPSKFKGGSNYKVRLASYEDPIWFDIGKAKNLGKIEQWTKGGWTIFILSGYKSLEEAEKAKIRAINKGFADAEIVYDNDGILERLKTN
ncbi:MAG: hypothetical protein HKN68_02530 [Saprospiraceae bacterium]|nr:hypothetical protein [Saprospiraceae bacterium]